MPLLDFADAPVIPVPYLPAFLVPFLGLLALPPLPAWWAVVALNVLGLGVYLLRLRSVFGPGGGLYWLPLLALPAYLTVLFGQVNLLLLIGFGEFLLALRRGRCLRAGLWLSLLLVKPQSLLLVVPGMIISGRSRVLLGFAAAGAGIGALSFALAGIEGARWPGPVVAAVPRGSADNLSRVSVFHDDLAGGIGASCRQHASAYPDGPGDRCLNCHGRPGRGSGVSGEIGKRRWLGQGSARTWPLAPWRGMPTSTWHSRWLSLCSGSQSARPRPAGHSFPPHPCSLPGCSVCLPSGLAYGRGTLRAGWTMFGLNLLLLGWSVKRLRRPSLKAPSGRGAPIDGPRRRGAHPFAVWATALP